MSPPPAPASGGGPPKQAGVTLGPIRLERGQATDLVTLVVLLVAGVGLEVAQHRTGIILLGSAAYLAWTASAVLAGWLVRDRVRHLWRRLGGFVDNYGLWILLICTVSTYGFLATAPGRIKTVGDTAGQTLATAFVGTLVGLLQLTPGHRDRAFRRLRHLGWLTPVLYSGCFFVCALVFFTEYTLLSGVRFEGVRDVSNLAAWRVASFYIWHFTALLPLADVPDTLRWAEPLRYRGADVGRLVILFQLVTTTTIFAAFRAYWKFRSEPVGEQPPAGWAPRGGSLARSAGAAMMPRDPDRYRVVDRPLLRLAHRRILRRAWMLHDGALSSDGAHVATIGEDCSVRVWDVRNGRETVRLSGEDRVRGVAFSPAGELLATVALDGTARLRTVGDGREAIRLRHEAPLEAVAFSADGTRLAATGRASSIAWELPGGAELARINYPAGVWNVVAISADGRLLATAGQDGAARVCSIPGGREVLSIPHRSELRSVAFSPDGEILATAGTAPDPGVRLWSLDGKQRLLIPHEDTVLGIAFSADGTRLASIDIAAAGRIWTLPGGEQLEGFGLEDWGSRVTFSVDGLLLLTVTYRAACLWPGDPEAGRDP